MTMEMTFWTYLAVLKRRFWLILLLLAATMAVILGRAWTAPPVYRSSTVLQAIPLEPEEVTLYTRLDSVSSAETVDLILFQFSDLVRSTLIAQRTIEATGIAMTAADLAHRVSVQRDPAGDLLSVFVDASMPEHAEQLLGIQIDLALREFRERRARSSGISGEFLQGQLARAEADLATAREAVLQFKLANSIEYLDRELVAQQQAIRDLIAGQQGQEIDISRLEAELAEVGRQSAAITESSVAASSDGAIAVGSVKRLEELEARASALAIDIAGARGELDAASALMSRHQTELAALITLGGRYQALQDEVAERQTTRDFIAAKAREARLKESQSRDIGYLQIVSAPSTPRSQVAARTLQVALLGALLSIVGGGVLVFLLEFLERSLASARRAQP